jgi:hypothetical protein
MANLVLFALTRRESSASPAGRNARSSRPIHRRQTGPGFSIIRKSPLPPQRWHAQSPFSGRTTSSSGSRLVSSTTRRSRFFSESFGEIQCQRSTLPGSSHPTPVNTSTALTYLCTASAVSAALTTRSASAFRLESNHKESMCSVAPQLFDQPVFPIEIGLHRARVDIGALVGTAVAVGRIGLW